MFWNKEEFYEGKRNHMFAQEKYNLRNDREKLLGIIFIILMIIFAAIILLITPYLPDNRPYKIKSYLKKQGYDVENIDFTYVTTGDGRGKWIYKSSESIFYEGAYIDCWLIEQYRLQYTAYYYVTPYIDD